MKIEKAIFAVEDLALKRIAKLSVEIYWWRRQKSPVFREHVKALKKQRKALRQAFESLERLKNDADNG